MGVASAAPSCRAHESRRLRRWVQALERHQSETNRWLPGNLRPLRLEANLSTRVGQVSKRDWLEVRALSQLDRGLRPAFALAPVRREATDPRLDRRRRFKRRGAQIVLVPF